MAAGVYDLQIEQGASFYNEIQWLVQSKENPEEFVPVDITAYKIRCQIRRSAYSALILRTVNTQIIDAKNGLFAIYLNAIETASLPTNGAYWKEFEIFAYDIEVESGTGVERLLNGKVFVSPNVTRDDSGTIGGDIPGGIDPDEGGGSNPDGGETENPKPETKPFFSEVITTSETSAWMDSNKYTLPSNMTKIKITATNDNSGGVGIGYIANDEPWEEHDDVVSLDLSSGSASCVLNVTAGSIIRPIFNYWSGKGTLTISLEGSETINNESAVATLAAYTGK